MSTLSSWREELEKGREHCEKLQAFGEKLDLPDGFRVDMNWNALDWNKLGETIHEFSARVRQITAILGPPVKAEGGVVCQHKENERPNLKAYWVEPLGAGGAQNATITIKTSQAKDCKLDPRTPYVPSHYRSGKSQALHPECIAVLSELEDAGATTSESETDA